MKGTTKMVSFFLKIMEIGFTTVGLIAIFTSVITLESDFVQGVEQRSRLLVGEAVLSSECLVVMDDGTPVKGLLEETKLKAEENRDSNPSCLSLDKKILLKVEAYQIGMKGIDAGETDDNPKSISFPVALKSADGKVSPTKLKVYVE